MIVLHFSLKLFEFLKGLKLVVHQVDVSVPLIINKYDEVLIPSSCTSRHRPTKISVYKIQNLLAL